MNRQSGGKVARAGYRHSPADQQSRGRFSTLWEEVKIYYLTTGIVIAALAAILVFIGGWLYCAGHYGFLFGFGFGWLPAGILAYIALWILGALAPLWPLTLAISAFLIFLMLRPGGF
jgi:hypothetical protein